MYLHVHLVCFFQRILGEILEVDEDKLELFDELEGAPALYECVKIEVEILRADNGDESTSSDTNSPNTPSAEYPHTTSRYVQCFTFVIYNFNPVLLDLPHLEEYTCPWPTVEEYQKSVDEHNGTAHVVYKTLLMEKGIDAEEAARLASETAEKLERRKMLLNTPHNDVLDP